MSLEPAQIRIAFPGHGVAQVVGEDAVAVLQRKPGDGRLPTGLPSLEIGGLDAGSRDAGWRN